METSWHEFCGTKWRQVGMKGLHCLCWHFTMVGNITKPMRRDPGYTLYIL